MSELLWPGLHRAGSTFDDHAVVAAMVRVELCWTQALEAKGVVPQGVSAALDLVARDLDADLAADGGDLLARLAVDAEGGGNPLIPLLAKLRSRLPAEAAVAVHRGLTSQDVVDTALVLCAQDCARAVGVELDLQVAALGELAARHRETPMAARTLGQYALPTTFGARAAGWQLGLVAAGDRLRTEASRLPVQLGGAAGTRAAVVEACRAHGDPSPPDAAAALVADLASRLGLDDGPAWHVVRWPVTAVGDALVTVSDALGHLANDVVLASRSEVGELSEPAGEGRGVSSAMPQKHNPVLSVLVRRHAMSAPLLGAQLHVAAAGASEERPDGAWHTEWAPLRDLCVRTLAAARQATELVGGLQVHADSMRRNLEDALPGALAERLVVALAPALPGGAEQVRRLIADGSDADGFVASVTSAAGDAVSEATVRELLDPRGYLGSAVGLADAAHDRVRGASRSSRAEPPGRTEPITPTTPGVTT